MKICFATSECVPYGKTGGLADVSGALPKALANFGVEIKTFMPLYNTINTDDYDLKPDPRNQNILVHMGRSSHVFSTWNATLPDSNAQVYFVDCPDFFHRDQFYTNHPDEAERFIFFQLAVLRILQNEQWAPDVIHCNDWQTALLPVMLKLNCKWDSLFEDTRTLLTIHNIGYQGRFSADAIYGAGLPYKHYYPGGPFEFFDSFCFLKAGIVFADKISTVSETYAKEIQTPEFGCGLEGVLRQRKDDLYGILNGIDDDIWNPATDVHLKENYTRTNLAKKRQNKRALLRDAGLQYDAKIPVIGIISRLAIQKGFDILQPVLQELMDSPVQFVILGTGEPAYERFLHQLAQEYPDKVSITLGFNEGLAHRITAGADMFLMPSHYEPCGLNQMYSLNYGTVPIVRHTGGLADTIVDYTSSPENGNGLSFRKYSGTDLNDALNRALKLFKNKSAWKKMMERGMNTDFSWNASAKKYHNLYKTFRSL